MDDPDVDDPGWPSDEELAILERISDRGPRRRVTDEELAEMKRRVRLAQQYRRERGLEPGPAV